MTNQKPFFFLIMKNFKMDMALFDFTKEVYCFYSLFYNKENICLTFIR